MDTKATLSHGDYTIGWICALPLEMAAATLMMDTTHPSLPTPATDNNSYILGNIGRHNIVIACLPSGVYGSESAATVAMTLISAFQSIRFSLLVGIGGGVPTNGADIRLGDIVVSQPSEGFAGLVQCDTGRLGNNGRFEMVGSLNPPPSVLLSALAQLKANHQLGDSQFPDFISNIDLKIAGDQVSRFLRPSQEDHLYEAEYDHGISHTCADCDKSKLVVRPLRDHEDPVIHYGPIASLNRVITKGRVRNEVGAAFGAYCIELEAAGLMDDFPCLVIRGISDYADSHKNNKWQGFAAVAAAAYAKELILQVDDTPAAHDTLATSGK